jgi:hypothetical protein
MAHTKRYTDLVDQVRDLQEQVRRLWTRIQPHPDGMQYEKVGSEAGDGDGGGTVDLSGYLHYGLNSPTFAGPFGGQNAVSITTTAGNGLTLIPMAGTGLRIAPDNAAVQPLEIFGGPATAGVVMEILPSRQVNINGPLFVGGLSLEDYIRIVIDVVLHEHGLIP